MKKVDLFKNYKPKNKPNKPVEPVVPTKEYETWDTVKYLSFSNKNEIIITKDDFPNHADRLYISRDHDYDDCYIDVRFEKRKMIGVESNYYQKLYKQYEKSLAKYKKDLEEYDDKLKRWEEDEKQRRTKYSLDLQEGKLKQFQKLKKELKELGIGEA